MNRRNVQMFSGDSVILELSVHNRGELADLSSTAFTYSVASSPQDTALITKTLSDGVRITGTGTLEVELSPADTEDLPGDDYYHELTAVNSAGKVTTLMFGTLEVRDNLS